MLFSVTLYRVQVAGTCALPLGRLLLWWTRLERVAPFWKGPDHMSRVVIPLVGLLSKACLYVNRVHVNGLDILQNALKESNRKGKGVLTSKCLRSVVAFAEGLLIP